MPKTPLTERDAGYIDAMTDADEEKEAKEKRRRAALSPHKQRVQDMLDALDAKVTRWDRSGWDSDIDGKGSDLAAVWPAIDALIAIHDTDGDHKKSGRARWFIRWVRNQAVAKLNT